MSKKTLFKLFEIFDELKKVRFSYITLYIIALALLYKYAYYNSFSVDITNYIKVPDLSVFLIKLLPRLIYFFLAYTLIFLLFFILSEVFESLVYLFRKRKIKHNQSPDDPKPFFSRIEFFLGWNILQFGFFYLSITEFAFPFFGLPPKAQIPYYYSPRFIAPHVAFLSIYFVSIRLNSTYLIYFLKAYKIRNFSIAKIKLCLLAIFIFFMTGTIATFNAGYRMSSFNYSIREFEYSDTQISTLSDNLVYVGETTEYVFIFHKDLVKTSAFPKAEINNLKFYNFEAVKDLEYWKYIKEEREKRNKEEID